MKRCRCCSRTLDIVTSVCELKTPDGVQETAKK